MSDDTQITTISEMRKYIKRFGYDVFDLVGFIIATFFFRFYFYFAFKNYNFTYYSIFFENIFDHWIEFD